MLNNNIDGLEKKIYLIFENSKYIEIRNLEDATKFPLEIFFVVIKENKEKTKAWFNHEHFFAHSKYTILDKNLNPTNPNISGWELININEIENDKREVIYTISDPKGILKHISNLDLNKNIWTEYYQIEGICKIIDFIRTISIYPDWLYYELKNENEKQKLIIENLNKELETLKILINKNNINI